MKNILTLLLSLILLFPIGCKETEQEVLPVPPPDGGQTPAQKFTLSIKPSSPVSGTLFTAIISAVKEDGTSLYADVSLVLTMVNGILVSNTIELAAGKYTLNKLLVKDAAQNVIIASPQVNSEKAIGTIKPLPLAFTEKPLRIESVSVNETDLPEEYGYPSSEFGERPYTKIIVKSVVNIGGVQYTPDTSIKITANGWTKEVRNGSETLIPRKHDSYHFTSTVWETTASKDVLLTTMNSLPTVILETFAIPKRIKVEETSTSLPTGGTIVTGKKEYSYNQYNQVSEIRYYQKKNDSDEQELIMRRTFGFANNELQTINVFAGDDSFIGYTLLGYDPTGNIKQIEEKNYDMKTSVTFTHHANGKIDGNYTFSNGNTMTYTMTYSDKNKTEDAAFGTGSETGKYTYDDKINPYYFLNYPDLFLSNSSKNNRTSEVKIYGGNIPSLEVYATEYSYDAQGYPELVIKSYRGYTNKEHAFKSYVEYTY